LYSYYSALIAAGYDFGGKSVQGYRLDSYANQQLGWESTMQYDLGLDAAFLNNRLTFTLDYYKKVTDDILLNLDIPAVLGLKPSPQNAGTVLNRGWEFSANYQKRPSAPGAFAYQLNGNLSINHNEVTDLKGTGPYIAGSDIDPRYIIAKGLPINTLWGYKTDGLFQSAEEIQAYGATYATNTKPGDVKYVDLKSDGVINANDMAAIGNSFPKYTFGISPLRILILICSFKVQQKSIPDCQEHWLRWEIRKALHTKYLQTIIGHQHIRMHAFRAWSNMICVMSQPRTV